MVKKAEGPDRAFFWRTEQTSQPRVKKNGL